MFFVSVFSFQPPAWGSSESARIESKGWEAGWFEMAAAVNVSDNINEQWMPPVCISFKLVISYSLSRCVF